MRQKSEKILRQKLEKIRKKWGKQKKIYKNIQNNFKLTLNLFKKQIILCHFSFNIPKNPELENILIFSRDNSFPFIYLVFFYEFKS